MMGKRQQSVLITKALRVGATSCVCLGLGLGWAAPVLGNEDVIDVDELLLDESEAPATTVTEWMAQIEVSQVQITGVSLEATETGLTIMLETAGGNLTIPDTQTEGNAVIADIPNAVLALPAGDSFEQFAPATGIALVSVTEQPDGSVRVAITGTDAPPSAEVSADASTLMLSVEPGVITTADADEDAIQVAVTGEQTDEYYISESSIGTRFDVPLQEVPLTIQVIPQAVIEDRAVVRLDELNDLVSSVQTSTGYGGLSSNQAFIRGFSAGENLRNGFRDSSFLSPRDVANIEQVEYLKGPASILYGALEPGGVINTVTEQPRSFSAYEIGANIGNFDFYRSTVDLTGPITDDRSLLYRLNIAYENANSFRDFVNNESIFVAPILSWQIGPRTNLTAEFEYQHYEYVFDRGFRAEPEFLELPRDRFLGEPDFSFNSFDSYYASYRLNHEFSDNWRLRQGFAALIVDEPHLQEVNLRSLEADRRTLTRAAIQASEVQENFTLQTDVIGEFQTGSIISY